MSKKVMALSVLSFSMVASGPAWPTGSGTPSIDMSTKVTNGDTSTASDTPVPAGAAGYIASALGIGAVGLFVERKRRRNRPIRVSESTAS
jgi:hypothetical protein